MLEQKSIDLLEEFSDRTDVVIFYCGEVFRWVDLEEEVFETDNSTIYLKDANADEFTVYQAEELQIEDDIFEFIKDYKKVLKSVNNISRTPNKLTLFMKNEFFITVPETLENFCSLEYIADYIHSFSIWQLIKDKKITI